MLPEFAAHPWSTLILLGLIATASVLILHTNWQALLLGLLSQYVLAGLALIQSNLVQIAGMKIFTGMVVCSLLFITIRVIPHGTLVRPLPREDRLFRVLGMIVMTLTAYSVASFYLPFTLPFVVVTSATWLFSAGLIILLVALEPLRIGLGLLTLQTGFEILYVALDESLVLNTLLSVETLVLALALAYLIVARARRSP